MNAPAILPRLLARTSRFVTAVGTAALAAGCAPATTVPPATAGVIVATPALQLLATNVRPAELVRPDIDRARLFGSVSGLALDKATGRYLGIIDDRLPARAAWLDVLFADGRLTVSVAGVEPLTAAPGVDARRVTGADLEAVVALPDGTFVAVEEGHVSDGRPGEPAAGEWQVALVAFTRGMVATEVIAWPRRFDLGAAGLRDNQGAESLTLTPDGRLVAGLEQPLRSDVTEAPRAGPPSPGAPGGPGRLVEFVRDGSSWRAARQWMYPLEPTPTRDGFDRLCDDGENGLTELLATGTDTFLSMERACLLGAAGARNTIVIYHVSVAGADDVSAMDISDPSRVRGATKTKVLDFDTLIPMLPPELALLDNFEAMAFGPTLPDGSRTLLVASDDNFRATQKTVFLLFRLVGVRS